MSVLVGVYDEAITLADQAGNVGSTYLGSYSSVDEYGYADGFADGVASAPQDTTPPTVSVVDPPEGVTTADAELQLDVADEDSIAYVGIFASIETVEGELVVYRRGAFVAPFEQSSYTSTPVAGTTRFHVRHNSGAWPPGAVQLFADIVDGGGNLDA